MAAKTPPVEMVLCGDKLGTEQVTIYLRSLGYHDSEITRLLLNHSQTSYYLLKAPQEVRPGRRAVMFAGMGAGGAIGSMAVGILGAWTAIGTTLVVPPPWDPFGMPLFVEGPIVGGLVGAGAGGMAGGCLGFCLGVFAALRSSFSRTSPLMIAAVREENSDETVQDQPQPSSGENS